MPVVEGQVFLQAALVFGLIGLLGLVLRWTFGRDTSAGTQQRSRWRRRRRDRGEESAFGQAGPTDARNADDGRKRNGRKARGRQRSGDRAGVDAAPWGRSLPDARPISPAPARSAAATPHHEDYGLLAVAADVATADEAATVRRLLKEAGIRNTNALAPDGRHKVLVFGHELMRARRVAGGGATGTGTGQGAGGS